MQNVESNVLPKISYPLLLAGRSISPENLFHFILAKSLLNFFFLLNYKMLSRSLITKAIRLSDSRFPLFISRCSSNSSKKPPTDDIKIDLKELNEKLESSLKSGEPPKIPEIDDKFMSFKRRKEVSFMTFVYIRDFSIYESITFFYMKSRNFSSTDPYSFINKSTNCFHI